MSGPALRYVTITFDVERGNYPIGSAVRVPIRGELLATLRRDGRPTGTLYYISNAREIRRRDPQAQPRFALRCLRLPALHLAERPDWHMRWYDRKRTRRRAV